MTPGKAIRKHCVECVDSPFEVAKCGGDKMLGGQGDENGVCYLFPYRLGKGRTSVKVIRKFCLECMGNSYKDVRECPSQRCFVFQYRFGKNPKRAGITNTGSIKSCEKQVASREIAAQNQLTDTG